MTRTKRPTIRSMQGSVERLIDFAIANDRKAAGDAASREVARLAEPPMDRCDGCGKRRRDLQATADGVDLCHTCGDELVEAKKVREAETPMLAIGNNEPEKMKEMDAFLGKIRLEADTPKPEWTPTFDPDGPGRPDGMCTISEVRAAEKWGFDRGYSAAASIGESGMAARDRRIEKVLEILTGALKIKMVNSSVEEAIEILRACGKE